MIHSNSEERFNRANNLFDKISKDKKRINEQFGVVEYSKKVGDKTFGIIKENNLYTVKFANNKNSKILSEEFQYLNGYEDRKRFQRVTLQEAIKLLHLHLNEDRYVVDVPVPTEPEPVTEPQIPPMDNPTDADLNGSEEETPSNPNNMDDMENDGDADMTGDNGETDDEKEIQKMTGKLAADLREKIDKGDAEFTVGIFKSIIAAAKKLPEDKQEEIKSKVEDVFSGEETEPQVEPENTQEIKENSYMKRTIREQPEGKATPPKAEQVAQTIYHDFQDIWEKNDDMDIKSQYSSDGKYARIHFMTGKNYDLFVLYFVTSMDSDATGKPVLKGEYDLCVVSTENVDKFFNVLKSGLPNKADLESVCEKMVVDQSYTSDFKNKIRSFLTSDKSMNTGKLRVDVKGQADSKPASMGDLEEMAAFRKSINESIKKEKNYTEEEVEEMISKTALSLNKLKKGYNAVIQDPETLSLLNAVYEKLYNLRSIKARKKEMSREHSSNQLKKENAMKTAVKMQRPMAETGHLTVRGDKLTDPKIKVAVDKALSANKDVNIVSETKNFTIGGLRKMIKENEMVNSGSSYLKLDPDQFHYFVEFLESSLELFDDADMGFYEGQTGMDVGQLMDYYSAYGYDSSKNHEQELAKIKQNYEMASSK